jgi:TolB-like protein
MRIAVARFDNQTGDPAFDRFTDALTDAVIAELTTWGENKIAVVGNAAILRQSRNDRNLLAIHESLKTGAIILGEVQRSSDGIHVFAQLIGLPDQSHRKAIRIHSAEADPVRAQSELAIRIRTEFAKPLTLAAKP